MKTISLGYSPCPNDTFIFYALIHGKINTGDLKFREVLLDVETLNRKALNAELDLTKISCHAFGHLREKYTLLKAGGALGRGCGPLVVTKHDYTMEKLQNKKIAIPGKLTTAFLLLQLYGSSLAPRNRVRHESPIVSTCPLPLGIESYRLAPVFVEMPFDRIMNAVANEEVDAGLIIHESRFTYPSYGLKKLIDLGDWWEGETGRPIPLGGIIAKKALGSTLNNTINTLIRQSVEYAFNHRSESMEYIKQHSQELSEEVINQHINLYVNDYSLDLGEEGEKAVLELFSRAEEAGIIPKTGQPVFI
ncbi:MAG: 1,4-dihydroxy-6-naphthoate synthase [Nitrospiraceae bacterium]|nr:MAG: 1,4-dihydroxy-6-naphthoate synthase [Nitrospiraceae bacterium]